MLYELRETPCINLFSMPHKIESCSTLSFDFIFVLLCKLLRMKAKKSVYKAKFVRKKSAHFAWLNTATIVCDSLYQLMINIVMVI